MAFQSGIADRVGEVIARAAAEAQARGLGAYLIVVRRADGVVTLVGDDSTLRQELENGGSYVTVSIDAKGGC